MKRKVYYLDAIFVLMNISSPYTLIPCFLFTKSTGVNSAIIFILTLFYIFFRFRNRIKLSIDKLLVVFAILSVYNLVNATAQGTLAFGFVCTFLANCTFYTLLYNLYCDYKKTYSSQDTVKIISEGYVWLCFYQLFIVALMVLMIKAHIINPLSNEITWDYDIFADNASRFYSPDRYFFPLHLSVVCQETMERLPFLNMEGVLPLGMFHEPHTMTYYIVPFLFLMHCFYSRKKLLLLDALFAVYMLIAASTTNILCVLSVLLLWSVLKEKKMIIIYGIIAFTAVGTLQINDNPIIDLIKFKLESGSMEYSASTLDFAFKPNTLFGTNFYDMSYLDSGLKNYDIGYIVFIFNIVFLLLFIYRTVRLCLSSNNLYRCVGLFSTYFILHSAKLALRTYSLEMLMFVIFMVTICSNERKQKQYA